MSTLGSTFWLFLFFNPRIVIHVMRHIAKGHKPNTRNSRVSDDYRYYTVECSCGKIKRFRFRGAFLITSSIMKSEIKESEK